MQCFFDEPKACLSSALAKFGLIPLFLEDAGLLPSLVRRSHIANYAPAVALTRRLPESSMILGIDDIPIFRYSDIPIFRYSDIPIFRYSDNPIFGYSNTITCRLFGSAISATIICLAARLTVSWEILGEIAKLLRLKLLCPQSHRQIYSLYIFGQRTRRDIIYPSCAERF